MNIHLIDIQEYPLAPFQFGYVEQQHILLCCLLKPSCAKPENDGGTGSGGGGGINDGNGNAGSGGAFQIVVKILIVKKSRMWRI